LIGLDVARLERSCDSSSCSHRNSRGAGPNTSNNSAETEAVTVTGEATGSLTSASPEEPAKQEKALPGAFTVKTTDDMELGRASNFEDLLQ
jgi:hypothetical protein